MILNLTENDSISYLSATILHANADKKRQPIVTAIPQASRTPEDVSITVRNREFDLEKLLATDWLDNDAFKTAFFNSMSISFPVGEKAFIESVRFYSDRINDPKLKKEMSGFFGQEGMHRREHQKYNEMLCAQRGYDLTKLESPFVNRINRVKSMQYGNRIMLASTCGAEHFTAILAAQSLNGWMLGNVDSAMKNLWLWHASEELEHKSVAFDVYNSIGGKYTLRRRMYLFFTFNFLRDTLKNSFYMLHKNRQLWKLSTFKSCAKFLLGREGLVRTFWSDYKAYYQKDFHPWDEDNRHLLDNVPKILV